MKKSEALSILGLQEGCTPEEIKAAHRKAVRASHPDRFAQDPVKKVQAEEKTKLINEARDVLESGKWEPEGTYGNPYAGNPYYQQGTPTPGGQNTYNWGGTTWTVWTDVPGGNANGAGFNPFDPFSPFNPFQTKESKIHAAKRAYEIASSNFRSIIVTLLVIVALCGICVLKGNLFSACVVFALLVATNMMVTRIGGCMWFVALPAIFYAIQVAMSSPAVDVGIVQLVFGGVMFVVMLMAEIRDISRVYHHLQKCKASYEEILAEEDKDTQAADQS